MALHVFYQVKPGSYSWKTQLVITDYRDKAIGPVAL
jgi:hypothetical protein